MILEFWPAGVLISAYYIGFLCCKNKNSAAVAEGFTSASMRLHFSGKRGRLREIALEGKADLINIWLCASGPALQQCRQRATDERLKKAKSRKAAASAGDDASAQACAQLLLRLQRALARKRLGAQLRRASGGLPTRGERAKLLLHQAAERMYPQQEHLHLQLVPAAERAELGGELEAAKPRRAWCAIPGGGR